MANKAIKCSLHVNNRWGYCYTPQEFPSINQAVKAGREYIGGFAWYVFVDGKMVRQGYCNRD